MSIHLHIVGIILLLLAVLHVFFPRYFGWREELAPLSLLTRQIFYVHYLFISLTVGLMGVLTLSSSDELLATPIGRRILFGLGLFWLARLFCQFFVYSPSLWRGKRFETAIHLLFTALWIYLSATFSIGACVGVEI
jgi:hypothetical protein